MDSTFAARYAELERRHWWFRARRCVLKALLAADAPARPGLKVLEIGCGPGANLREVYPEGAELSAVEPDRGNAELAGRESRAHVLTGTAEALPDAVRNATFDLICLFDVLEHLEDDGAAVRELSKLLRPGGILAATVPAFASLWGRQDVVSRHFRRYTRRALIRLLHTEGVEIVRATYFNTFLFLPVAVSRWAAQPRRASPGETRVDFDFDPAWARQILYRVFSAEAALLPRVSFPFGVSVYASARKQ
jgi:SAM-dependent methyltransferase